MPDELVRRSGRSLLPAAVAAAGTVVATIVAVVINLITSSWSPALLAALAALVAVSITLPFVGAKVEEWTERRSRLREEQRYQDLRLAELYGHFRTRGQGLTRSGLRRGWYFTGRRRALAELVGWIEDREDTRARLVTGAPGSGKSAVLGRLVTLAHPRLRADVPAAELERADAATIPPAGSVRAAINARGLSVEEAGRLIGEQLGVRPCPAGRLPDLLAERRPREPTVVVVDAVDEASDPAELIRELLEPLASSAHRTGVRLLAGLRPGWGRRLVRQFGARPVELDLDAGEYSAAADLAEYVFRLLIDDEDGTTPYRGQPEQARTVAQAVAARADKSFLVAQLAGLALASAPAAADVGRTRFPDNVGAAMEQYLGRFGADRTRIRDLLMPLALAEGEGLSDWSAWALLATEFGARRYTDQDITWLLRDTPAPDVLQRGTVEGRFAYRLFHLALNEYLRGIAEAERPAEEIQRRFAEILMELADGDWDQAGPYTRTYLPTHAAAGGVLDPLLEDARFLVAADPARLLQALPAVRSERGREMSFVVQRAGFGLLRSGAGQGASYLELAARKCGEDDLANAIRTCSPESPWSVPWARWARITCGNLLGHLGGYVRALSIVDLAGGPIVIATGDTEVRAWRLADGAAFGPGIRGLAPRVKAHAVLERPPGVEVRTWHADGTVQRWDLGSATPIDDPISLADAEAAYSVEHDGREVLVSANGQTVRMQDEVSGEPIGADLTIPGLTGLVAVKELDGRLLAIAVLDRERAQVWDLAGRLPVGPELAPFDDRAPGHGGRIWSGDLARFGERTVALIGHTWTSSAKPGVQIWDAVEGRQIMAPLGGHRYGAFDVTMVELGRTRLICAACGDGVIVCREWPPDNDNDRSILAHDGGVDCITGTASGGTPTVVSGGRDGAVRAWPIDLIRSAGLDEDTSVSGLVAVGTTRRPLVTGLVQDRSALVTWDATTGEPVTQWPAGERVPLKPVVVEVGDEQLIVTAARSGGLKLWDPLTGELRAGLSVTATLEDGLAHGVSSGRVDGRAVLLVGAPDRTMRLWDVQANAALAPPIDYDVSTESSVTFLEMDDAPYALGWSDDTYVPRLWCLPSGEPARTTFEPCAHDHKEDYKGSLAVGMLNDRLVGVMTGSYSNVDVWDLRRGHLLHSGQLDDGHKMALGAAVVGRLHGRQVVISSGYAGAVTIWDLDGAHEVIDTGSPVNTLVIDRQRRIIAGTLMGLIAIDVGERLTTRSLRPS